MERIPIFTSAQSFIKYMVIDQTEAVQTVEDVTHGGWTLERA